MTCLTHMQLVLKKRQVKHRLVGAALLVFCVYAVGLMTWNLAVDDDLPDVQIIGRHLMQVASPLNCTPRSIDQFPPDFLTPAQRQHGGVVIHLFIVCYIFAAIAIVCDDYFVSSLEKISTTLKLQPDVAGATFMAAGSSAPELFTAIVGVFFAKSDVGIGTIVGSAIFNLLVINAVCGLFAGMVVYLTWWPLLRDCSFYAVSVITLVAVIHDEVVLWYEAMVMMILYVLYIILMYFNRRLGNACVQRVMDFQKRRALKADIAVVQDAADGESTGLLASGKSDGGKYDGTPPQHDRLSLSLSKERSFQRSTSVRSGEAGLSEVSYEAPFTPPDGWFARFRWGVMLPASLLFVLTVPDCRRPGCWVHLYPVTFLMSIAWLAGLSYLMVWMVTIIGDTLGIPDTVMGLTLLAAGTSVPDCLASLYVARDGFGDMAVSNSIGSNVFDILVGLGLPWLIQTAAVAPGSALTINSSGLTISAIVLLATVFVLPVVMMLNRWRLTKTVGLVFLGIYLVVVTLTCLSEMNVFGNVNPPPCPRIMDW